MQGGGGVRKQGNCNSSHKYAHGLALRMEMLCFEAAAPGSPPKAQLPVCAGPSGYPSQSYGISKNRSKMEGPW